MIPSGFDLAGKYAKINKEPTAILPYTIDWGAWLSAAGLVGETITASVWTPEAGIVVVAESVNGTETQVVLSGGADGSSYIVENHITLAPSGFQDSRRIEVVVVKR